MLIISRSFACKNHNSQSSNRKRKQGKYIRKENYFQRTSKLVPIVKWLIILLHYFFFKVPTMTVEQEMAKKCTVRPAKGGRPTFHRTLSRKSLNFEKSPQSSPQKTFFDMAHHSTNYYNPQSKMRDETYDEDSMFAEATSVMNGLQLKMDISLSDDDKLL